MVARLARNPLSLPPSHVQVAPNPFNMAAAGGAEPRDKRFKPAAALPAATVPLAPIFRSNGAGAGAGGGGGGVGAPASMYSPFPPSIAVPFRRVRRDLLKLFVTPRVPGNDAWLRLHNRMLPPPGEASYIIESAMLGLHPRAFARFAEANEHWWNPKMMRAIFEGGYWPLAATRVLIDRLNKAPPGHALWLGACTGDGGKGATRKIDMIDPVPMSEHVRFHPCDGKTSYAQDASQAAIGYVNSLPAPSFVPAATQLAVTALSPGGHLVLVDYVNRAHSNDAAHVILKAYEAQGHGTVTRETITDPTCKQRIDVITFTRGGGGAGAGAGGSTVPLITLPPLRTIKLYSGVLPGLSSSSLPPLLSGKEGGPFVQVTTSTARSIAGTPVVYVIAPLERDMVSPAAGTLPYVGSSLDGATRTTQHIGKAEAGGGNAALRSFFTPLPVGERESRAGVVTLFSLGEVHPSYLDFLGGYKPLIDLDAEDFMLRCLEQRALEALKEGGHISNAHDGAFGKTVHAYASENGA